MYMYGSTLKLIAEHGANRIVYLTSTTPGYYGQPVGTVFFLLDKEDDGNLIEIAHASELTNGLPIIHSREWGRCVYQEYKQGRSALLDDARAGLLRDSTNYWIL